MDCIAHGVAKCRTRLSDFHFTQQLKRVLDQEFEKGSTGQFKLEMSHVVAVRCWLGLQSSHLGWMSKMSHSLGWRLTLAVICYTRPPWQSSLGQSDFTRHLASFQDNQAEAAWPFLTSRTSTLLYESKLPLACPGSRTRELDSTSQWGQQPGRKVEQPVLWEILF